MCVWHDSTHLTTRVTRESHSCHVTFIWDQVILVCDSHPRVRSHIVEWNMCIRCLVCRDSHFRERETRNSHTFMSCHVHPRVEVILMCDSYPRVVLHIRMKDIHSVLGVPWLTYLRVENYPRMTGESHSCHVVFIWDQVIRMCDSHPRVVLHIRMKHTHWVMCVAGLTYLRDERHPIVTHSCHVTFIQVSKSFSCVTVIRESGHTSEWNTYIESFVWEYMCCMSHTYISSRLCGSICMAEGGEGHLTENGNLTLYHES